MLDRSIQELTIDTLTNLGLGLGRVEGLVVMVPFCLPGERVRAKIYREHKNYSEGDLEEVLEGSPERVEPRCPLFGACGGCQYQHLAYEGQLVWKRQQIKELFERIGKVANADVQPVWPSPMQYGYRSKLTPHFQKPKSEAPVIGFLAYGRRSRLVDVERCPIALDGINEALPGLRQSVFDSVGRYKRGATLLLRASESGVTTDPKAACTQSIGKWRFQFTAGEFFQNNPYILPEMVDFVLSEAHGNDTRYLVDTYCGVGVFGLCGSERFEAAVCIEVNPDAIEWAKVNAADNGIGNVTFVTGSAEHIFENIRFPSNETAVILDPPRKGCDAAFLDQLLHFAPQRIVYVSCAPDTQARDLQTLLTAYTLVKIQPFDLFPQTRHIENVITLVRRMDWE
ncbi:MAG: hypothetical protein A2Y14_04050 [Verrucomicrobia bacterium GWF2_51_19]|nr:MAG: hypothetical protein A2Y14_04050 [Verrucomicrobia bacterium GWF2_51_19]